MDQDVTVRDDDLLFTVDDGIGRVTFNRPQARNAFTFEMYERLAEICERANRDHALVWALARWRPQADLPIFGYRRASP